jgi:hypothetical protein
METVREILAAHGSGISKPGLLAWARLRIDTAMTDAQLDEELARLGDEVVDVDGVLDLRSVRERALDETAGDGASQWAEPASADAAEDGQSDDARAGPWDPGAWSPPPPAGRRGVRGIGKVIGLVFVGFWVLGLFGGIAEGFFAGWTDSATPAPTRSPDPTPTTGSVIPFLVAAHPDGAYPTDEAFGEFIATVCPSAFESWTGSAYEDQDVLDYSWFTPTEESWTDGYQTFDCYLALADGSLADRSYRDANP